ncbi:MAG: peptidase S41 [Anaerolineales bacterium]|nr:peptidase S41 [Anaerolineales bacterium]
MKSLKFLLTGVLSLALLSVACNTFTDIFSGPERTPQLSSTLIPVSPIQPGEANPNEPVQIRGTIPFTSPFFINSISEPYVLLEDEAGFVARDHEFEFPLAGQVIGPVELIDDSTLQYNLILPSIPAGTLMDVDNDGEEDVGVMIFAVAYWSNTWGDPFLEARDGTGWSTAYTSAITDPERDDEIVGGTLIVWAPDDEQGFPNQFGADGLLFTEDDPTTTLPAGYSVVNLDQDPFRIYKETQPEITLFEGEQALNDYSDLNYVEAFDAFFKKASREYPFTLEKGIDWDSLYAEFAPRVAAARNDSEFYIALRDLTYEIPDGHVGVSIDGDVFFEEQGGGLGLLIAELNDGRVIATDVLSGYPASQEGIEVGAEIITWNGSPVTQAIDRIQPYFGPYSTDHHKRMAQVNFLTRMPPNEEVTISYRNPSDPNEEMVTLQAVIEYDSLFAAFSFFNFDPIELPLEAEMIAGENLGYIRITTFSDDYHLLAQLWERYVENLIDNEVQGVIIDIRTNGGGNGALALDFVDYVFDEEIVLSVHKYYNENTGEFEESGLPSKIEPGPVHYDGEIAVLIGPDCASACESFANALSQGGRSIIVGYNPSAGMFGEVGRGQYELPGDLSIQFPTGRPETLDGELLIEGVGVIPDINVPVTEESALGFTDPVLEAAIEALLDRIGR